MVTSNDDHVITAQEAADLALITYRQLDHWARKSWITPSVQSATGRGKRRLYSIEDVLRLAALRHFAASGWAVADLGEQLASIDLESARWLVAGTKTGLTTATNDDALFDILAEEDRFSVVDLDRLRARLEGSEVPVEAPIELRRLA